MVACTAKNFNGSLSLTLEIVADIQDGLQSKLVCGSNGPDLVASIGLIIS